MTSVRPAFDRVPLSSRIPILLVLCCSGTHCCKGSLDSGVRASVSTIADLQPRPTIRVSVAFDSTGSLSSYRAEIKPGGACATFGPDLTAALNDSKLHVANYGMIVADSGEFVGCDSRVQYSCEPATFDLPAASARPVPRASDVLEISDAIETIAYEAAGMITPPSISLVPTPPARSTRG